MILKFFFLIISAIGSQEAVIFSIFQSEKHFLGNATLDY